MNATLGFSSHGFVGSHFSRALDFALEEDFGAVEIALLSESQFAGGLLPNRAEIRELASRSSGIRLSLHAPVDGICLADPSERVWRQSMDALRRCIDIAISISAEVVTCHLYYSVPHYGRRPGLSLRAAERLGQALGDLAREARWPLLALENKGYSSRAADMDYGVLAGVVDSQHLPNLGITFDLGHAHIHGAQCGDIAGAAGLFGDRVVHYHVHDNDGSADQHLPVGRGNVDFRPAVARWCSPWGGLIIMEVFQQTGADVRHLILESRRALMSILDEACGPPDKQPTTR